MFVSIDTYYFVKLLLILLVLCATMPSRSTKTRRLRDKQRYANAKEEICAAHKEYYNANADVCKNADKMAYDANPERKKEASKMVYVDNPLWVTYCNCPQLMVCQCSIS